MEFIKILNEELCRQGLSCQKLGEMSGVTPRLIRYYRKGERTPSIHAADKVLKALGVTLTLGEPLETKMTIGKLKKAVKELEWRVKTGRATQYISAQVVRDEHGKCRLDIAQYYEEEADE